MSDKIQINSEVIQKAWVNSSDYQRMCEQADTAPDNFWDQEARKFLAWQKFWDKVSDVDFSTGKIAWFLGAKLNVCFNCVDRHIPVRADKTAIIWEGNRPGENRKITYKELQLEVARFAGVLKKLNVNAGDRVAIYMPMIPEAAIAMLACARIGAIHSVIFAGFSADSLAGRIKDADAKVVVTSNIGLRGDKIIPLKKIVDQALEQSDSVESVILVPRTSDAVNMKPNRDYYYSDLLKDSSPYWECPEFDSEHPLFLLYTSGSTGKPKGLQHSSGGYLLYAAFTHKYVFDYHENDIYFCAADIGWITGHTYVVYGPLANGATTLMFESMPTYPDASRYWDVIERNKVSIFYTAPTAIRALAKEDLKYVDKHDLSSLRILGSVGEPINPATWQWYYENIGKSKTAVVDTWWQTETGGIMISPIPGAVLPKPGSACLALPGIKPVVLGEQAEVITENPAAGKLCISRSWPGQARTIWKDHQRFIETYFTTYPGYYFTGDGCQRDLDAYYWITGRVDDVLNVSGHRLGTAEIESALVASGLVAEAAVVGMPHDIKGTAICAFCILNDSAKDLKLALSIAEDSVVKEIGALARPERIIFVPGLPKTRSGKIMRRILRKLVCGEIDSIGDISTLAEPEIVAKIQEIYNS